MSALALPLHSKSSKNTNFNFNRLRWNLLAFLGIFSILLGLSVIFQQNSFFQTAITQPKQQKIASLPSPENLEAEYMSAINQDLVVISFSDVSESFQSFYYYALEWQLSSEKEWHKVTSLEDPNFMDRSESEEIKKQFTDPTKTETTLTSTINPAGNNYILELESVVDETLIFQVFAVDIHGNETAKTLTTFNL